MSAEPYCGCAEGARGRSSAARCATCGDLLPPSTTELATALNALQDAISEARTDGARAGALGDVDGAAEHRARAERLRRVYRWLQTVDP